MTTTTKTAKPARPKPPAGLSVADAQAERDRVAEALVAAKARLETTGAAALAAAKAARQGQPADVEGAIRERLEAELDVEALVAELADAEQEVTSAERRERDRQVGALDEAIAALQAQRGKIDAQAQDLMLALLRLAVAEYGEAACFRETAGDTDFLTRRKEWARRLCRVVEEFLDDGTVARLVEATADVRGPGLGDQVRDLQRERGTVMGGAATTWREILRGATT